MSNYPDDCPGAQSRTGTFECNLCDFSWQVDGTFDLGSFSATREADTICPNCEDNGVDEVKVCPSCDGEGFHSVEVEGHGYKRSECETCDSTGEVPWNLDDYREELNSNTNRFSDIEMKYYEARRRKEVSRMKLEAAERRGVK